MILDIDEDERKILHKALVDNAHKVEAARDNYRSLVNEESHELYWLEGRVHDLLRKVLELKP